MGVLRVCVLSLVLASDGLCGKLDGWCAGDCGVRVRLGGAAGCVAECADLYIGTRGGT